MYYYYTFKAFNCSLKLSKENVIVVIHETFSFSSSVTKLFNGKRYLFSVWLNVATTGHRNSLTKLILALLCDESGATVRKNNGNLFRSLKYGDVEPKDTYHNYFKTIKY